MTPTNGYTVETLRTIEGVEGMRGFWQETKTELDADIDFYLEVLKSRQDEVLEPYVMVLRRDGAPQSILVGRVEKKRLRIEFGYMHLFLPTVRSLTFVHGGFLGENSERNASELLKSVTRSLTDKEAEVAYFHHVDGSSAMYQLLSRTSGFIPRDRFPRWNDHRTVGLPRNYTDFLKQRSGNMRYNLKRYSKRLMDGFGDRVMVRSFGEPDDVPVVLADCETIAQKTYHRGLGTGFLDNDETRRLITLAARHRWLRSYILYIAGKPCAFWNGFLYQRTFSIWTTAFDPDYQDFRPGLFLLQCAFEDLCKEHLADKVDFGFGDAQYKRDWSDANRREVSMFLFAPTLKGAVLNGIRTPLIAATESARQVMTRLGLLAKVKKMWRNRLASRQEVTSRP